MSRKDTIIVAVLINAGLLIVLFASALKSGRSDEALVMKQEPVIEEIPAAIVKKETPVVVGDEVDRALQQLTAQQLAVSGPMEPPAEPHATAVMDNASFVADLKSIATPEAPVATAVPTSPAVQTLVAPLAKKEQKLVPDCVQVTVKKGDVLEKIARHHHSSVAEIMKANQLTSTQLRIGQVLKIPQQKKEEVASPSAQKPDGAAKLYVVKKGDSPWTIAVKNQMKVEDLLKLNNMTEAQAKRLKPGDQLRIQ